MIKRMQRVLHYLIIFVCYLFLFAVRFRMPLPLAFFTVGLILGFVFQVLDSIVQVFLIDEFKTQKNLFLSLVKRGKFLEAIVTVRKEIRPVSASFYFLALYFPLAIFLITSSGSVLGLGVILGLGLFYTAQFILRIKNVKGLRTSYFSILKSSVSDGDVRKVMGIFIFLFLLLSGFVLVS